MKREKNAVYPFLITSNIDYETAEISQFINNERI